RILRSDVEAEEILRDVFWEVWQSAGDWNPRRGSPEAWVVDRARNRGIDRARSLRGRGEGPTGRLPEPLTAEPRGPGPHPPGGGDRARFEAHLAGCAECERLLGEYREALVGLAADVRQPPPGRAKRDMMARVGRRRARGAGERFWSGLRWAASVAVAAGLLASVAATYVSGRYESQLGQMAREVAALRGQVGQQRLALALLRDPATQVVLLAGLTPSPQALGRLMWNEPETG